MHFSIFLNVSIFFDKTYSLDSLTSDSWAGLK